MAPKELDLPAVEELAEAMQGDPLGIAHDFENSQSLVELARWRFQRNQTQEHLMRYRAIMLEVAVQIMSMGRDTSNEREWFLSEYDELQKIVIGA